MTAGKKRSAKWEPPQYDSFLIRQLASQRGISLEIAQILYARGITKPEEVMNFLAPCNLSRGLLPPERLPGCQQAAALVAQAIVDGKQITIYGDYDVDGMTATAILTGAINTLGGKVNYYLPNRLDQGYGLNCDSIARLAENGTKMIISVDCGITSLDEAIYAKEKGIELIVTDHHKPVIDSETGRAILPDVAATVHPNIPGTPEPYPWPELCGAAVALKLAWGIGKAVAGEENVSPEMREFLKRAVGLAALGTVADVVPLTGENRTIVRFAIENSLVHYLPLGLKRLMDVTGLTGRRRITSEDIGFAIAPRLNAAGREVLPQQGMGDEEDQKNWLVAQKLLAQPSLFAVAGQMGLSSLGVELLLTTSENRARELADFVGELNKTRQKIELQILHEAHRQIASDYADAPAFVLAGRNWHPGVIGIVAGRIAEEYHRPTVMLALRPTDPATGSARGTAQSRFSIYDAFEHCKCYLERFGGHSAAAGLGINEANIKPFRAMFCDYASENLTEEMRIPLLKIDVETTLAAITPAFVYEIDKMAPFGAGNPRPLFSACNIALAAPAKRLGGKGDQPGRVFSARFRQERDERRAISFSQGDWVEEMNDIVKENPATRFDIVFQIMFNDRFNSPELRLIDWRISEL